MSRTIRIYAKYTGASTQERLIELTDYNELAKITDSYTLTLEAYNTSGTKITSLPASETDIVLRAKGIRNWHREGYTSKTGSDPVGLSLLDILLVSPQNTNIVTPLVLNSVSNSDSIQGWIEKTFTVKTNNSESRRIEFKATISISGSVQKEATLILEQAEGIATFQVSAFGGSNVNVKITNTSNNTSSSTRENALLTEIPKGSNVKVEAIVTNTLKQFDYWEDSYTGNVLSRNNPYTISNISANHSVIAHTNNIPLPEPETYTIRLQVEDGGYVQVNSVAADQDYEYSNYNVYGEEVLTITQNSAVTLSPKAEQGYVFKGWDSNYTKGDITITGLVTEAITHIAHFEKEDQKYTVNFGTHTDSEGTVTVTAKTASGQTLTSGSEVVDGTVVTFTATCSPSNTFTGWYYTNNGTLKDGNTNATYTITVTQNVNLYACFGYDPSTKPASGKKYNLTIHNSADGGGVKVNGSSIKAGDVMYSYDTATSLTLTADPADGYEFTKWWFGTWQGDHQSETTNPITVTVLGSNMDIRAEFHEKTPQQEFPYKMTVSSGVNGQVRVYYQLSDDSYDEVVNAGDSQEFGFNAPASNITLTAIPATGYEVDKWSTGATGTQITYNLSSSNNGREVYCSFKKKSTAATYAYEFGSSELLQSGYRTADDGSGTVQVKVDGTVVDSGTIVDVNVETGKTIQVVATPASGCLMMGWKEEDGSQLVSQTNTLTLTSNANTAGAYIALFILEEDRDLFMSEYQGN